MRHEEAKYMGEITIDLNNDDRFKKPTSNLNISQYA